MLSAPASPATFQTPPPLPQISLLRYILLAGLLVLVTGALALGGLIHTEVKRQINTQARDMSTDIAQSLAPLLLATDPAVAGGGPSRPDPAIRERLSAQLRIYADVMPLLAVSVTDGGGRPFFSTDASRENDSEALMAGQRLAIQRALQGEVSGLDSSRKLYVIFDRTLSGENAWETFIPLYRSPQDRENSFTQPAAVVTVTLDMRAAAARFDRMTLNAVIWVIVTMGILYALLLVIARHLDGLVRRQQIKISAEANERREAEIHLRRVQDAMENTIAERTSLLRQSEARFREFAESASDWLWEADSESRLTYISEGFSRIMGIDTSMVLGRQRWVMSPAQEDSGKWEEHRACLAARRPFRGFNYTFILPGGKRRFVSINGAPVFDQQARFCGYRGTGSDITLQHEAEQTIIRLGRILEQSVNEVYILDHINLRVLQANRGARINLGYSMGELSAMTLLDLQPAETPESLERWMQPLRKNASQMGVFETHHQRKDGTRYPVEARLQYMSQEQPPVYVAVIQDITARRRAEQALQESEERYRSIAQMSLDAIVVHVDGIIVFANQQAIEIAGASTLDDLVGQPIARFVHPDCRDKLVRGWHKLNAGPSPQTPPAERQEWTLLRADGHSFDAELSSSAIAYGGRPAVQTVLRDITEQKLVQSQLIQTAKLATLGEMAAGMAHELSQPMNVIRMAAEGAMLGQESQPTLDEASRNAFTIITGQASRMGDIIDHMRIFSRKQTEVEELFSPARCLASAVRLVGNQISAEDIVLQVQYPPDDILVSGRPVHLEQVLLNLLTNARDALRPRLRQRHDADGSWIPCISIHSQLEDSDSQVRICVSDTGGGIPAEYLERVFEPFFTTKDVGAGTGLGLSISFNLILAMKGQLSVCNHDPGTAQCGAEFTILLPVARPGTLPAATLAPAAAATHLPPPQPVPLLPLGEEEDEPSALVSHILVVDDEEMATALLREHLQRQGYRVTTASDGEEGFACAMEDPPDLLLTDLRMPRCDGRELIRRLHDVIPDLPVIVVTGHLGHLETAAEELKNETVAILKKPISLAELNRVLANCLVAQG